MKSLNHAGVIVLLTLLSVVVLLVASSVALAKTPAGTKIVNQGVILYEDQEGNEYTTTSNQVIIVVTPVYGISILPDGTAADPGQEQDAVASQTVYYPYTLTNTGNTDDIYILTPTYDASNSDLRPQLPDGGTGMEIFWDKNVDGVVDAGEPLVASWNDTNDDGIVDLAEVVSLDLGPLVQDEVTGLIISYTVPGGAASGDSIYAGVDGASTHNGAVPAGASEDDVGNINKTTVINDAVIQVTKSATPLTLDPGASVEYKIDGLNAGTQAANTVDFDVDGGTDNYTGVLVYDVIPTYSNTPFTITGTPSGGPSGGTIVYANPTNPDSDPAQWDWSTSYTAGWKVVGYITDGALDVDASASLTFSVVIPLNHPAGYVHNYGWVHYADNQDPQGTHIVKSNDAPIEVRAEAGVVIEDTDYLSPPPPDNPADDGSGTSNDTQTYPTAAAGETKAFTNRVRNTGSAEDIFDIALAGGSTIPADWTVTFYNSDGLTPLADTDGDGTPDTGPIAPDGYRDIVVKVFIPADQPTLTTGKTAIIQATSSNDTQESDTTSDVIEQVTEAGVEIQNRDSGPDPSPTIAAGQCAQYPLDVINTGQAPDVFTLSWTGLAAGWEVVFYRDSNDNGIVDDSEKDPVTKTIALDPGQEDHFVASVCSPDDAIAGLDSLNFTATSTNNTAVSDTEADTITVSSACAITLVPDRSGIVRPGGVVWYEHILKNTGDQQSTIDLVISTTTPWTHIIYYAQDYDNGSGYSYASGDPVVDTDSDGDPDVPNLASAAQVLLSLKVFAPSNVAEGKTDIATLTAVAECGAADDAVNITQVVSGGLVLHKQQSIDDYNGNGVLGDPGDRITYTTNYKNLSAGPLLDVTVYEMIPVHTSYVAGSAQGGTPPAGLTVTIQFSNDGGASWSSSEPTNVTNIRWQLSGPLPSGSQSLVGVSFAVEIQ